MRPAELMRRAVADAKAARAQERGEPDDATRREQARAELEAARKSALSHTTGATG